jgi:hypothetical protein
VTTPIKLIAAITLTFGALAIALAISCGIEAVWVVPPLLIFGGLFLFFRHWQRHPRSIQAPRLLWSGVLIASVAAWAVYFGSVIHGQSHFAGIDEPLPEPHSFLERPWLVHQVYLGLFRSISVGGADSIISAAVILLSVLLPILAVQAFAQIRHARLNSESNGD